MLRVQHDEVFFISFRANNIMGLSMLNKVQCFCAQTRLLLWMRSKLRN